MMVILWFSVMSRGNSVKALRTSLEADMAAIAKKYGITIELGNASISDHECNPKLNSK